MAFDERLAQRVRDILAQGVKVKETRMFGGLAFMVAGHMCCGVTGRDLVVRVGPDNYDSALSKAHARPMDFTGRALTGFVYVGPSGTRTNATLRKWINQGVRFVLSLPPK